MSSMEAAYEKARHDFALALMDIGAVLTSESIHPKVVVRKGPQGMERGFMLKLHEKNPEAPLSPFYLNLRTPDNPNPGPLMAMHIEMAGACMRYLQLKEKLEFDSVVGVPWAGEPFAKIFGKFAGTPCIEFDKWEHNGKRKIASLKGKISIWAKKALMIDDVVVEADSKCEAIDILQSESMEVTDVVVLVDREQGGRKKLAKKGCNLHSVFTITELLDFFVDADRMEPRIRDAIRAYLNLRSAPQLQV